MGLLDLSQFSSIPTFKSKAQSRRKQKETYSSNFSEWGAINGLRIVRNATGAGTTTLYTVPEGRVLFITAVHCSVANDSTPNARGIISIGDTTASGVGETMLNITTNNLSGEANVAVALGHPVKVEAGEIVQAKEISSNSSSIGFIGFELPRSLEIV